MSLANLDPDRLAYFRLRLVPGVGPATLKALLQRFESPQRVLAASSQELLKVRGVTEAIAAGIQTGTKLEMAEIELRRMERMGARLLFATDADYPASLREIADYPMALMVRGDLRPTDRAAVAIVGSRRCSTYGIQMATRLGRELASRGLTIISGLARGIDAAAHRGALEAKGRTIAVLASGLANIYPPEHRELADAVAASGALVSEAPLDGPAIGQLFPQRNRVISGLSVGVVVVEAAARSGALSTARHALEQNREVFAVPGRVGDPASEGTNQLLKQGAHLVATVDDVLEALGPIELTVPPSVVQKPAVGPAPVFQSDGERDLWEALGTEERQLDELLVRTGLTAADGAAALFYLEMRKLIRRLPGNRFVRAD